MITVILYDHPNDFPNDFVARLFDWDQPTSAFMCSQNLDVLREWAENVILEITGCFPVRFSRDEQDDRNIIEIWM